MLEFNISKSVATPSGSRMLEYSACIRRGECVAVRGESGAGKTTLLRMLAGLLRPDGGSIRMDSTVWFDSAASRSLAPGKRRIGYVSQEDSLFPHMTVEQNIAYGVTDTVYMEYLLRMTGLGELRRNKPATLSGGQRQRVALCRALSHRPTILLLDEPFSALDRVAGASLQRHLSHVRHDLGCTVLLVTHNDPAYTGLIDRTLGIIDGRCVDDQADRFSSGGTGAGA